MVGQFQYIMLLFTVLLILNPLVFPATQAQQVIHFLSDLNWISVTNDWGPVERNRSNGEEAAGDGQQLMLNGTPYAKGLGVHAESDIRYDLGGQCQAFRSWIGIDDEVGSNGSVVFVVYLDGRMEYASNVLTGDSQPIKLDIPIDGVHELRLRVTSYDSIANDHADWAEARIVCGETTDTPPAPTSPPQSAPFVSLPGMIEAENAVTFSDNDTINHGGVYRTDSLDVQLCDVCVRPGSAGYSVGWIGDGEWLEYPVSFAQGGTYQLRLHVAVPNYGRVVQAQLNGVDVGSLELPYTGGWYRWTLAESRSFTTAAGPATLRLSFPTGAFELDMIEVVRVGADASPPLPTGTSVPTATSGPTERPTELPPQPPPPTQRPTRTPTPTPPVSASQAQTWARWERTLNSDRSYSNPYADLTVRVTYRGPNGEELRTYGFWDGNNTFRIRAMFPSVGTWSWETVCSDTSNTGLHNQRGTVVATASQSDNPLY